jgi:thioredoxin-like negative regulator of GroEL
VKPEVLIFTMEGCSACEALKPLAGQMGTHYQACVDTRVIDVDRESRLADAMGVEETPTVIGVNPGKHPIVRMVGHDGTPERLVQVYSTVLATVTSCTVDPFRDV